MLPIILPVILNSLLSCRMKRLPMVSIAEVRDTADCDIANDDNNPLGYTAWKATQDLNIGSAITDNCGGIKSLTTEELPFEVCGTREYRFTITDSCDQVTNWSAFYTVIDTVPPTFIGIPGDTSVSCDDPYLTATPPVVTARDNCGVSMTPIFSFSSDQELNGSCKEYQYTLTRTWGGDG